MFITSTNQKLQNLSFRKVQTVQAVQSKVQKKTSYVSQDQTRRPYLKLQAVAAPSRDVSIKKSPKIPDLDWNQTAKELATQSPTQIIDHALSTFGSDVAIAFSGAEDVAVIEHAHLTGKPFRVFSLDTGRLNPETYKLFDAVEKRYNIHIEYTFPDAQETMDLVRNKGMFSFYQDSHQECCRIRKVRPLRRQLKGLKAWITGQRRDQSPGTRADVQAVEVDPVFEGLMGGEESLVKYNPLFQSTSNEVWNFLRIQDVPVNELHAKGFVSIGCEPCTKSVLPNQHEREGRWWWEDTTAKECGLHSGNLKPKTDNDGNLVTRDLFDDNLVKTLSKDDIQKLIDGPRDQSYLVVLYAPWCQYSEAMEPAYEEIAKEFNSQNSGITVAKFNADVEREFVIENFKFKTFPTILMLPKWSKSYIKFNSERRTVDVLRMWSQSVA